LHQLLNFAGLGFSVVHPIGLLARSVSADMLDRYCTQANSTVSQQQ
jgi:hypothetical protein